MEQDNGAPAKETAVRQDEFPTDAFPLSDELIRLLEEYRQQMDVVGAQQRGALMLFVRQHNLQGEWRVAPNGRELVRRSDSGG